jgi:hypothetical protein
MRVGAWSWLVLAAAFGAAAAVHAGEKPQAAATRQATEWLALVDRGEYGASWDAAAAYFRGAVTREAWTKAAAGARAPLGAVLSRKVKSAKLTTTLPGAPDGNYVVIQFATSFANKKKAVETVTPMKEADGSWKVSGYFVK